MPIFPMENMHSDSGLIRTVLSLNAQFISCLLLVPYKVAHALVKGARGCALNLVAASRH